MTMGVTRIPTTPVSMMDLIAKGGLAAESGNDVDDDVVMNIMTINAMMMIMIATMMMIWR